jgi:hypothetical protein
LMQMRQELGPADDMARLCYSAVRHLSVLLRDRLHQEGLWEDLMQEVHLAAWESWQKGLSDREAYRLAARRIYAFLKACGYVGYRKGYCKLERPFSFISEDREVVENVLARAGPASGFMGWQDHLEETILSILRESPGGLSRRDLYTRLRISAQELQWHCAPLLKQRLITEVKRENGRGRPPTPLLVADPAQIPEESKIKVDRDERIRQAYFLEGKGIKWIERELHHNRHTVRKAIMRGTLVLASRR